MKKLHLVSLIILFPWFALASESIKPTVAPTLFRYNDAITVTYDVTGTPLANLSSAYIWVWIPGKNSDANFNVNPAGSNPTKSDNAKFTKSVVDGKTIFTIVFTPSAFFVTNISSEKKLGMLLKGNDWSNGQTTDFIADIWDGSFSIKLLAPTQKPFFVTPGESVTIEAETPVAANYELFVNGISTKVQNGITHFSYPHVVAENSGSITVKIVATSGSNSNEVIFSYSISENSPLVSRPAGIIPGINYRNDNTRVTVCLWAPGKNSVYVLGDFNDWEVSGQYLMKRDGEYFWIEITNITPGTEYGFQYLINESVFVADPYASKILDPDDQYISSSVYPDLKKYPTKAVHEKWYFNRVAVFQTDQQPYVWQAANFKKPAKKDLIIYELLIRDFFGSGSKTYKNLIDTVGYFKRLGINAVELMPVMEFNGNDSWGYNPTFMFAPDKSYGTQNQLKAFVDKCHKEGIAVILDVTMNHHDAPNPYVLMDFDNTSFKPTTSNKWFNITATHPYNVFFDMNHESSYTKAYLDTVAYYWLHEFNVDGYRFDLSKGFTQKNNPSDVSAWGAYDASRIAILKRMADKIWSHSPDAYIILEHFASNDEEKELAEYHANEGKGMMLWGNLNHAYNQNTIGFSEDSDFAWVYHGSRNWNAPHVVGYMESHDEERLMYKNLQYGNSSGAYNIKTVKTAIDRMKAANVMFYTIPGPKMLWQFGEMGYDQSINRCEDGSITENCRISSKPTKWDYLEDADRHSLFIHTSDIIRLRNTYSVFTSGEATLQGENALIKQLTLKNQPYTASPSAVNQMNVQVAANFNITSQTFFMSFPHSGTWYDYYAHGKELVITSTSVSMTLNAGEYKLYTDVKIDNPLNYEVVTAISDEAPNSFAIYPVPSQEILHLTIANEEVQQLTAHTLQGAAINLNKADGDSWNTNNLSPGFYLLEIVTDRKTHWSKLIKK